MTSLVPNDVICHSSTFFAFFQSSLFEIISSNKIFVRSSEIFARSTKLYTVYVEFSNKTNRGPKIFATVSTSTRWSVGLTNLTTQNSHALLVNNPHTNHWLRQYHPKRKIFFYQRIQYAHFVNCSFYHYCYFLFYVHEYNCIVLWFIK